MKAARTFTSVTGDRYWAGDDVPDGLPELDDAPWLFADTHSCDVCDFEAKSASGLAAHRRSHDDKD